MSSKMGRLGYAHNNPAKLFFELKILKLQPQSFFHLHYGDFFLAGEIESISYF